MTENEARSWLYDRFERQRIDVLERFATMVTIENDRQNLIAPSTVSSIWSRHIVDSAQLIDLAPPKGRWLDVGTGGGFPGMVVAILRPHAVIMVEPRRKRVEFLRHVAEVLGIDCCIAPGNVEQLDAAAEIISARAVASPEKLLQATRHCATPATRWLLPRGASGGEEHSVGMMMFHVKQSVTDATSRILIIEQRES